MCGCKGIRESSSARLTVKKKKKKKGGNRAWQCSEYVWVQGDTGVIFSAIDGEDNDGNMVQWITFPNLLAGFKGGQNDCLPP